VASVPNTKFSSSSRQSDVPNHRGSKNILSLAQEKRVVALLQKTELSFGAIGQRFDISSAFVGNINRKYGIRQYEGGRLTWKVSA
jgi:hypothetical protein